MSSTRASRSRSSTGGADSGNADDAASDLATASHYLNARAGMKRKLEHCVTVHNSPKQRRKTAGEGANGEAVVSSEDPRAQVTVSDLQDVYCWECHKECVEGALDCVCCPRTFHPTCLARPPPEESKDGQDWICPVCVAVAEAGRVGLVGVETPSLCLMLDFSLKRMRHSDSEAFSRPVPASLVPEYYDLIFHPLDLSTLERKVKNSEYASTTAFLEDTKWILHNSIIFNGPSSKYCADAKLIIKICRHEMSEIELCPDCYRNSVLRRDNWFCEPCRLPHCLVWAKLKGFPYWPAKALRISTEKGQADVRFFGAHDRAWIPIANAVLLSRQPPLIAKNAKKHGLDISLDELQEHVRLLKLKTGTFNYAPGKVELDQSHLDDCPLFSATGMDTMKAAAVTAESEEASDVDSSVSGSQPRRPVSPASSDISRPNLSRQATEEPQTKDDDVSSNGKAKGEEEALDATARDISAALPSEESVDVLERLQSSIQEAEAEEEPAKAQPVARKSIAATSAGSPLSGLFGNRLKPEARKRNLDMLVGRMRGDAESPPSTHLGITVTPAAKKSSVVITHERMPTKTTPRGFTTSAKILSSPSYEDKNGASSSSLDAVFQRHADKITSSVSSALKDMWSEAVALAPSSSAGPVDEGAAVVQLRWSHNSVLSAMRKELASSLAEAGRRAERDRELFVEEQRRRVEEDKAKAVNETKRKQWCANCGKEAVFYCCWNTSYCDYPCQQHHWPRHQVNCAQIRNSNGSAGARSSTPSATATVVGNGAPLTSATLQYRAKPPSNHTPILPKPPEYGNARSGVRAPHTPGEQGFGDLMRARTRMPSPSSAQFPQFLRR